MQPYSNIQGSAPLGYLMLFGACFGLLILILAMLVTLALKRK